MSWRRLFLGPETDEESFWRGLGSLVEEFHLEMLHSSPIGLDSKPRLTGGTGTTPSTRSPTRPSCGRSGIWSRSGLSFAITTDGVDAEIAEIAGPQLVVPVTNERYALNAANACWGSLYDALYGTDALGSLPPHGSYDRERGTQARGVGPRISHDVVPLDRGSHADVTRYSIIEGNLVANLHDGPSGLAEPDTLRRATWAR